MEEIKNEVPTSEEVEEEVETDETELESEEEDVETPESQEDSGDQPIDHETELQKERERLGKKIDKERDKRVAAEKAKGLSREDAEKLVGDKMADFEKKMFKERAVLLAERLASSPAERDLIMLHYDNSIIPSGNIEEDIDKAFALANRKKIQGTIFELKKANKSKETRLGGADAGNPVKKKEQFKFSKEDIEGAKFAGVSVEEFVKKKNE